MLVFSLASMIQTKEGYLRNTGHASHTWLYASHCEELCTVPPKHRELLTICRAPCSCWMRAVLYIVQVQTQNQHAAYGGVILKVPFVSHTQAMYSRRGRTRRGLKGFPHPNWRTPQNLFKSTRGQFGLDRVSTSFYLGTHQAKSGKQGTRLPPSFALSC